jgi:hypothetical protein
MLKATETIDLWNLIMADNASKRKKNRIKIPMKRVPGEMRVAHTNQTLRCRVFLHDISPKGVGIFVESKVEVGAKVDLIIEAPKHLFLKAEVTWCGESNLTPNVISQGGQFPYRVGLTFVFQSPEEEAELKKYCEQIGELTAPPHPEG